MMLTELSGPDPRYRIVIRLTVLTLVLIAAPFALYALHRADTTGSRAGRRS